MYTTILFPSTSITVPNTNTFFNTPVGAYIRPSTTRSITITATTNHRTQNFCNFSSITVPCAGSSSCITHVSVTFDDVKVLDTDVSEGFMDFTLYPDRDLEFPDGIKEINVVLEADIPSDSDGLIIKDISMNLFEDYK
ncbi:hypothetical protein THAR02_10908 [Trichoderma harzianum]|uniref:Uncharacterized protein n=1 Tax=Trichoderma harzianum TaxID=5544 RepID=A0A0F9ZV47_TRIHA|nr:hypothetical protein THAR02_10908 [Trichoderma harzianum]